MTALVRDRHSIFTEFCLFFILGNSVLALGEVPILQMLFSGLRMVAVGYAFALLLQNFRIGKFAWIAIAFYAVLFAVTFKHHGAMNMWVSYFMNTISIAILTYYSLQRSAQITIDIYARIFAIFIYFNFISMIIAPNGIFRGDFPLGRNYNQVGATVLCGMVTYIAAHHMHIRTFIATALLCAICVLTPIMLGSMTSAVGCTLVFLFFLIPNKKLRRLIIISFFVFYLVFQALVVFLQSDLSDNKEIAYFVENVLGKELTFSDRTRVWSLTSTLIEDSPITGYGLRPTDWFDDHLRVLSAHNIILQMLIYGGYILLSVFILVILLTIRRSFNNRSKITDTMLFGVGVFFFMMMMENYSIVLIFYMLNILFYTPELTKTMEHSKDSNLCIQPSIA